MRQWVVGLLLCAANANAGAAPLQAKNGSDVRIAVANQARHAFALKPSAGHDGWRLELVGDALSADIVDVTPGTPARTITVAVAARTLCFDNVRFTGGHVYQVQLRSAAGLSSGLVYLTPEPAAKERARKGAERVRFDVDDQPTDDSQGIARVTKGAL